MGQQNAIMSISAPKKNVPLRAGGIIILQIYKAIPGLRGSGIPIHITSTHLKKPFIPPSTSLFVIPMISSKVCCLRALHRQRRGRSLDQLLAIGYSNVISCFSASTRAIAPYGSIALGAA